MTTETAVKDKYQDQVAKGYNRGYQDHITEEKVRALKIPDDLKTALIGLIAIRHRFEEKRNGQMWVRLVNHILLNVYKDYRSEWAQLFDRYSKSQEPVKGNYDPLDKVSANHRRSDFVAKACEGCTTKELEAFKQTGKLPERIAGTKEPKDILEARTEDDVLKFFGKGRLSDSQLLTSMKAYALSIGVEIHQNTKKPAKIAAQILDMLEQARDAETLPK